MVTLETDASMLEVRPVRDLTHLQVRFTELMHHRLDMKRGYVALKQIENFNNKKRHRLDDAEVSSMVYEQSQDQEKLS